MYNSLPFPESFSEYTLQQQFDLHIAARWLLEAAMHDQNTIIGKGVNRNQYLNLGQIIKNLQALNSALKNSEDNTYQKPLFLATFLQNITETFKAGSSVKNVVVSTFSNREILISALNFLNQNINNIESTAQVVTLARIQKSLIENLKSYLLKGNAQIEYKAGKLVITFKDDTGKTSSFCCYGHSYDRYLVSINNRLVRDGKNKIDSLKQYCDILSGEDTRVYSIAATIIICFLHISEPWEMYKSKVIEDLLKNIKFHHAIALGEISKELDGKNFYDVLLIIIDKVKEKKLESEEESQLEEVKTKVREAKNKIGVSYSTYHTTSVEAGDEKQNPQSHIPHSQREATVFENSNKTHNSNSSSYRGLKVFGVTATSTIATAAIMNQLYKNLSVTVLSSLSVAVVSTTLMYLCTRSNNQPSPTLTSTEGKPVTPTQEVARG